MLWNLFDKTHEPDSTAIRFLVFELPWVKKSWTRRFAAWLLGVLLVFALPPFSAFPVIFVIIPVFLLLLWQEKQARSAFWLGWFFGFGFFLFGLHWISNALLVYSERLWWMIPFAMAGLPAVLAIFTGLMSLWIRKIDHFLGMCLLFGPVWLLSELARGYLFTGFPWNLIGYSLTDWDILRQSASLIGVYGQSFLLMTTAALTLAFWAYNLSSVRIVSASLIGLALFVLGAPGFSIPDLDAPQQQSYHEEVMVRIVQGNIPQTEKWKPEFLARNVQRYMSLSLQKPTAVPTITIWPETAMPYDLDRDQRLRQALGSLLKPDDILILGSTRREDAPFAVFNSARILNADGKLLGDYDKAHLVPFGEYVPFENLLSFAKVTPGRFGFSAGSGTETLEIDKFPPFSPLICYEIIFPGNVVNSTNPPQWILNLTNDAWYGDTIGPRQHLAQTRMRAVEQGLPVIRVASTGISSVFDQYGRSLVRAELNEENVILSRLPRSNQASTLYSRYHHWLVFYVAILIILTIHLGVKIRKKQP